MPDVRYFWEDLTVDSVRELGSVTPTAAEIKAFAAQFDPQPFHVDEEAAKQSIFGGLCASGWHTCSMAMKLSVDNFLSHAASLGSPGIENVRWLKPVFPGDTLTLTHTITESRAMRKRADVGLVRSQWNFRNQRGESVMTMEAYGMFRRRQPASPEELAQLGADPKG